LVGGVRVSFPVPYSGLGRVPYLGLLGGSAQGWFHYLEGLPYLGLGRPVN